MLGSIAVIAGLAYLFYIHWGWHSWLLAAVIGIFLVLGFIDYFHPSDSIRRQFPLFGRMSRLFEEQRHVLQELLLQTSTEGKPFSLLQRKIVYKRASDTLKNFAFGTELDYQDAEREWLAHSAFPSDVGEGRDELWLDQWKCHRSPQWRRSTRRLCAKHGRRWADAVSQALWWRSLVREARKNHPDSTAARQRAAAAAELPSRIGSLPDPMLAISMQKFRLDDFRLSPVTP